MQLSFPTGSSWSGLRQQESTNSHPIIPAQLPFTSGNWSVVYDRSVRSSLDASLPFHGLPVADQQDSQVPITSFMIRNIPCGLTRTSVMSQFDMHGFSGLYDYFHLPLGRKSSKGSRANLGYAFINFLHAEDAATFRGVFHGYSFAGTSSEKVCEVQVSRFQGSQAHLRAGLSKSQASEVQTESADLVPIIAVHNNSKNSSYDSNSNASDPTEAQPVQHAQPDKSQWFSQWPPSVAVVTAPEPRFQSIGTFQPYDPIASGSSHSEPSSSESAGHEFQLHPLSSDQWYSLREDLAQLVAAEGASPWTSQSASATCQGDRLRFWI
ncbi:unnamed protein product [Polarella glacialis]|uniref:Mei2-like C-terminal RNA recognition motif domain-containing protein n=1 Tax=Polarella glacialis TaxID=89957 RepID=A0A813JZE1_POLGL|nr:unnamed protein product [Polarella glacialis]